MPPVTGLRFVCDENLEITPDLERLAQSVCRLPGRAVTRAHLLDADVLLVRSVTQVSRELVIGTPVTFVGSATAGTEHVDIDGLTNLGIGFASAPGANAQAVAEYVLTVLAHTGHLNRVLNGAVVGVVGFGHVGQRVAKLLAGLGANLRIWDPYRKDIPEQWRVQALVDAVACPIVTLHAALHDAAPFPSRGLINAAVCEAADTSSKHGTTAPLLINAGRGGLVTREALDWLLRRGWQLALDTWPEEPNIDRVLLAGTLIGTPHIAGYSREAKRRATDQLIASLQGFLANANHPAQTEITGALNGRVILPTPDKQVASLERCDSLAEPPAEWLRTLLVESYDIARDDDMLRAVATPNVAADDFDRLRREYPLRSELSGRTYQCGDKKPTAAHRQLAQTLNIHLAEH